MKRIEAEYRLRIPCFGHAGDGNIHVNIMVDPNDADEICRAHEAEHVLFRVSSRSRDRSAASTASASPRRRSSALELSDQEIALMKRVKAAFDPHNLLNPGKIFPQ